MKEPDQSNRKCAVSADTSFLVRLLSRESHLAVVEVSFPEVSVPVLVLALGRPVYRTAVWKQVSRRSSSLERVGKGFGSFELSVLRRRR